MLRYKIDVIAALKKAGYSTYRIRNEKILTEAQLQHLRRDHLLTHDALDKLCGLLNCQPGDLVEFIPDGKPGD